MEIERFTQLVEEIYSASIDPDAISRLLNDIAGEFDCPSAAVQLIDQSDYHQVCEVSTCCSAEQIAHFAAHFEEAKGRLAKLWNRSPEERLLYVYRGGEWSDINQAGSVPEARDDASPVIGLIFREAPYVVHIAFHYPCKDISREKFLDAVELLTPHVHQAFKITRELKRLKFYSEGLEQAMDRLNSGVVLVDRCCVPVFENRRAKEIITSMKGLNIIAGKLVGSTPGDTRTLHKILEEAVGNSLKREKSVAVAKLRCSNEEAMVLNLVAVPLQPDTDALGADENGVYAALMIGSAQFASGLDPELLQLLYALTPAEARLAVSLSDGKSLEEYSRQSGISVNTVRSYLKLVFHKTDTNRQAELVALLRSIPVASGKRFPPGKGSGG